MSKYKYKFKKDELLAFEHEVLEDGTAMILRVRNPDVQSVNVPEGVSVISMYAFFGCKKLRALLLPDSLITIEDYAFGKCELLNDVFLPKNLTTLGNLVFVGCESLKNLRVSEHNRSFCSIDGSLYSYDKKTLFVYNPSTASDIDIRLPDTLERIAPYAAFSNPNFEHLTIPEGIREIGEGAFIDCDILVSVNLPKSLTKIGDCAFTNCESLRSFCVAEGNPAFVALDGDLYSKDMKALIQYSLGKCEHDLELAEGVESIRAGAISMAQNLRRLRLAKSTRVVGSNALYSCKALQKVELMSVEHIGTGAFQSCYSLDQISLPESLSHLGGFAFDSCSALREISVPKKVTQIDSYTFCGCDKLEKVTIGEGVSYIAPTAFQDCDSLRSATFEKRDGWYCYPDEDGSPELEAEQIPLFDMLSTEFAADLLKKDVHLARP